MIKIQIKNKFTGSIIFESKKENSSIKEAVKDYIKQELSKGLTSADLSAADLSYADLSSANLRSANLRSADLRSADLRSAKNNREAWMPISCKWGHSMIGGNVQIGCEIRSIKGWNTFFSSTEELETKRGTEDFKQIEAVFRAYEAYINHSQ